MNRLNYRWQIEQFNFSFFILLSSFCLFSGNSLNPVNIYTSWSHNTLFFSWCCNGGHNYQVQIWKFCLRLNFLRQGSGPGRMALLLNLWSGTQKAGALLQPSSVMPSHLNPNPASHWDEQLSWWQEPCSWSWKTVCLFSVYITLHSTF